MNDDRATMELPDACDELAQLIIDDALAMPGYAIQFFMEHIENGETPAMALALVKHETSEHEEEAET